jgi:methionyl-tRNA synthetase
MLASNYDGAVPEPGFDGAASDLPAVIADAIARYDEHMLAVRLQAALGAVWDIVARANQYLVEKEPWKLSKDPANADQLAGVLYASAETLRILAIAIAPIMPGAAERLWEQLGIQEPLGHQLLPQASEWGQLQPGTRTTKAGSLFPRVDPTEE